MSKEVLIKSGMQITQTDFSCNKTENMQARCVPRFIQRFLKFILTLSGFNATQQKTGNNKSEHFTAFLLT